MKVLLIPSSKPEMLLFSTPLLRALAQQKKASTDLIVKDTFIESFHTNPHAKEVASFEDIDISKKSYDVGIDLQNNSSSRKIARIAKRRFTYEEDKFKNWLFIHFKVNRMNGAHVVDRYFDLLSPLDLQNDSLGLDYFIPDKDVVENEWLPETHQNEYAVFAMGDIANTQQLPTVRLIELCDRINKPIILLGEKVNVREAAQIEAFFKRGTAAEEKEIEALNKKTSIFNACGKFNLNQQASIIENASWIFTYENIYMQIAAAFKKQVFSIWGSSTPLLGKFPYETKFTIFENNKVSCRPCSGTGYKQCPKGHFKCMNDLTFDFYLPD